MKPSIKKGIQSRIEFKEFYKNIIKVLSGSAGSAFISFLTLPILTRLYSPTDMGVFQILLSFIILFSAIGSLKYEMAIVLPKSAEKSSRIAQLAFFVLILVTLFITLLIYVSGNFILDLLKIQELRPYLFYLSIGIFLSGLIEIIKYHLIKIKKFGFLSSLGIAQTSSNKSIAISLGYFYPNFLSLFISHIGGYLINIIIYFYKNRSFATHVKFSELRALAKEYKKFPLVNSVSVFLNKFSLQLPIFMISAFFTADIVGIYQLAHKVVNLPLNLVSNSISQVYFKEASDAYNESPKKLMRVYKSVVYKLIVVGIIGGIPAFFLAPQIIEFVFGSEWTDASNYIQIIIFWIFFQFINGPVSTTFSIINKQEVGMYIIIISFILRYTSMALFHESIEQMLIALTVSSSLFYIIYNIAIYFFIKKTKSNQSK